MKAEKRKELHTNALAGAVGRLIERLKEKPGQTSYIVWGFIILAVASVVFWIISRNARSKADSGRWEQLAEATTMEELDRLIKNNKDTPTGRDARLRKARTLWAEGQPGLFRDDPPKTEGRSALPPGRTEAVAKLTEAEKLYEELAGEYGDEPLLAQECFMSAATIQVSLGNYDQGIKLYKELARKHPKSESGKHAAELASELEDNRAAIEATIKRITPKSRIEGIPPGPEGS